MGYTLVDYARAFHSMNKSLKLSAGVRSIYTAIVGEFDEQGWPERIKLSTRELSELAGLSVSSTHDAKNVLKNHKLIDFTNSKRRGEYHPVEYWLGTKHLPNTSRTLSEHSPNSCRTLAEQPSRFITIPSSGFDSIRHDDDDDAGARGKVAKATPIAADTDARAIPLRSPVFDANDIQAEWQRVIGYELRGQRALELEQLAAKDYDRAVRAIERTSRREGLRDEFSYFLAVYNGLKPQTSRGGEKVEQPDKPGYCGKYKVPAQRGDEPWWDDKYAPAKILASQRKGTP